jgi:hypothetical protein
MVRETISPGGTHGEGDDFPRGDPADFYPRRNFSHSPRGGPARRSEAGQPEPAGQNSLSQGTQRISSPEGFLSFPPCGGPARRSEAGQLEP